MKHAIIYTFSPVLKGINYLSLSCTKEWKNNLMASCVELVMITSTVAFRLTSPRELIGETDKKPAKLLSLLRAPQASETRQRGHLLHFKDPSSLFNSEAEHP